MSNSNIHHFSDEAISRALAPFGMQPSAALASAIREYAELLLRWNQKMNLTSITEPGEILARHFGESMFAARAVPIINGRLVDIGSGAGFPGLALKLVSPELEVFLIESSFKKSAFLAEVVRSLNLSGVKIITRRIIDVRDFEGLVDFVTCRAVKLDPRALSWVKVALSKSSGCVLWLGEEDALYIRGRPDLNYLDWSAPIPVPLSNNRVLLVGRRSPQ
jgi:16S rRNA (guanine527-N7)-methyltransferase